MLTELLMNYGYEKVSKQPKPRKAHWPSEAGKCIRALVYTWRGVIGKTEPRQFFVWEDGTAHHKILREQLRQAGVEFVMEEAPINDTKRNISGKIDAVIKLDGKYYPLEIKSVNRYTFEEIQVAPRDDHVLQLQVYLYYVDNLFKIPAKMGILFYKCKDTSRFWEYVIESDQTKVDEFFNTIISVEKYLKDGTLPDRQYNFTDWHCQYCDYKEVCWEGAAVELQKRLSEINEEELKVRIGNYIYLRDRIKELEDEKNRLSEEIKQILLAKALSSIRVENYFVEIKEQERKELNKERLQQVLGDLEPYYEKKTIKILRIKEMIF